jgi:hypothetical protein
MSKKTLALVAVGLGAIILIVSLAADMLGIGANPDVIGWKQLLGAGLGLIVILVGVWLLVGKRNQK